MSRFKFSNALKQLGLFELGNTPLGQPTPDDDPAWDERHEQMSQAADDVADSGVRETPTGDIADDDVQSTVDAWLRMVARDDPYYSAGL
jgi:hypothetical protein